MSRVCMYRHAGLGNLLCPHDHKSRINIICFLLHLCDTLCELACSHSETVPLSLHRKYPTIPAEVHSLGTTFPGCRFTPPHASCRAPIVPSSLTTVWTTWSTVGASVGNGITRCCCCSCCSNINADAAAAADTASAAAAAAASAHSAAVAAAAAADTATATAATAGSGIQLLSILDSKREISGIDCCPIYSLKSFTCTEISWSRDKIWSTGLDVVCAGLVHWTAARESVCASGPSCRAIRAAYALAQGTT